MSWKKILILISVAIIPLTASAQDLLPADNGLASYHTAPRYRASESHPIRVGAYILHPVGWLAREVVFRPFSYFASSTETTRSVMGFREPYDYRQPECFSADDSIPDCRAIAPFNYGAAALPGEGEMMAGDGMEPVRQVFFPDVNFDFDKRVLNDLGQGRARQIADLLNSSDGQVTVVLEGHTDYIGSEEYNEKLGLDRAEAVRTELVALGVSPEQLSTVTFGKTRPLYSDQTDWARAVNRRVEVHAKNDMGAAVVE